MDEIIENPAASQPTAEEAPSETPFMAPSIDTEQLLSGNSYTYTSAIPKTIADDMTTECVLGVDEAGRGPVLGPMVYGVYYLPLSHHRTLLADTHHFDDSKVLTPAVRSHLMEKVCTPGTDLHAHSGWATRIMSARDISSGQLRSSGTYNLNAQAMDATIALIQGVLDAGVNVREIYIDTIGQPAAYQKRLERVFPTVPSITVAKKADSLYPCVSAASVCAKVSRDAALDVLYGAYAGEDFRGEVAWGSGYPSVARCTGWLKANMHPVFGWGNECRFSWGTAKELLETAGAPCQIQWPNADEAPDAMNLLAIFSDTEKSKRTDNDVDPDLMGWYGQRATFEAF